ncbi:MAG: hypothetical protein V3V16_05515 [Melioribacteraceae bacterium]
MKSLGKVFVLLVSFSSFSFAQGEGALPFTLLHQSPLLLGAGQVGVSVPNDEVLGFYYNPAILGYSARNNHAAISFMPTKTEWFFSPNISYKNYGLNFGYNLKDSQFNLPFSIGVGYLHNTFSYGKTPITNIEHPDGIGSVENYDAFDCFSLGVELDYFLKFNFGISLKSFDSKLGSNNVNEKPKAYSAEGIMFDYGGLVILPISELWMNNLNYNIDKSTSITPIANLSFGYSLTNVGDDVFYIDNAQFDPLSRTARLGYTFELGADIQLNNTKLNLFKYSFTAEANDILVNSKRGADGNLIENYEQYQSGIGDINISDNLINLRSNNGVILHKGHIFRFFDTVIFTLGSFNGKGYSSPRETNGFGFTSDGILKLLSTKIDEPTMKYIFEHFEIKYHSSNVNFYGDYQTNFEGLSIHFKGFEI